MILNSQISSLNGKVIIMNYRSNGKEFSDLYMQLTEKAMEQFSVVVNKFLGDTFILRTIDSDDYYFSARNLTLLGAYFALIDYEIVSDTINGVISIKTMKNRNRIRLLKFETIIVLLLRIKFFKLYKTATYSNKIIMQVDELSAEVDKIQVFAKQKSLREYNDALKTLKRHKIVDFPKGDLRADSGFEILPTILQIVTNDTLSEVETRLLSYKKDSEDDYEETDED